MSRFETSAVQKRAKIHVIVNTPMVGKTNATLLAPADARNHTHAPHSGQRFQLRGRDMCARRCAGLCRLRSGAESLIRLSPVPLRCCSLTWIPERWQTLLIVR
jgi:hypothetical protein